jgi:hypothetical protein
VDARGRAGEEKGRLVDVKSVLPVAGIVLGAGVVVGGALFMANLTNPPLHDPEAQRAAEATIRKTQAWMAAHELGEQKPIDVHLYANMVGAQYQRSSDDMEVGVAPDTKRSYAYAPDVLAHEYTHRVAIHLLGKPEKGENGAVHESLADTIAAVIDPDWTIGEDVMDAPVRDMADPRKSMKFAKYRVDEFPVTMSEYVHTKRDGGGVHINAGIPNHAAYLIGTSLGRERMGTIYADVIAKRMYGQPMTFQGLAQATFTSAKGLYGRRGGEAVEHAWKAVGIDVRN